MSFRLLALSALASLASCASAPKAPTLPPLTHLSVHELDYSAQLTGVGLLARPMEIEGFDAVEEGDGQAYSLQVDCLSLDYDVVGELTGWSPAHGRAFTTGSDQVARLLETSESVHGVARIASPMLVLLEDQRGHVAVVNQTAYVSGFEVLVQDAVSIADPQVDVFNDGLLVEVRGRLTEDDERVALDVAVTMSDLRKPIPEFQTELFGHGAPVTIQQPVASSQHLETSLELAEGETLVLIGDALDGSPTFTFLFLSATPHADIEWPE